MPEAEAAVAIIKTSTDDYLLLQRASNPQDPWSGHLSLPGGRREDEDDSLLATAIRECKEECGIQLSEDDLLEVRPQRLAGRYAGDPILVAPFLFELQSRQELHLDESEIADAWWVEKAQLINDDRHFEQAMTADKEQLFPVVRIDESAILWGFTYEVLFELLRE